MSEVFHALPVSSVARLTSDAIEIVFAVPESLAEGMRFKSGQHVPVRVFIDGVAQRRTYSLCSEMGGRLRIGVKRLPGGAVSSMLNDRLKVGDTLEVAAPQGRFTLPPTDGSPRHLLMLAAGAGITPILGMINEALSHEPAARITLIYGNRTPASAMFLAELEDLKDRYPARLDVVHVLTGAGVSESELLQGRIDGEKLKALAGKLFEIKSVDHAFLCGPGTFIKETRNALFELGLPRERVHHEFFAGRSGVQPQPAALQPPAPAAVKSAGALQAAAILDGQRYAFSIEPGQRVLEAALNAGIKAPYSCTGGMCSTCRAKVVEGTVAMAVNYSLEPWEIERGFTLTCQAEPTSHSLVIDYDAM